MKTITFLLLTLAMSAALVTAKKPVYRVEELPALYHEFMKENNRNFASDKEMLVHFTVFAQTVQDIIRFNADSDPDTYRIPSKYADFTDDELKTHSKTIE